MFRAHGLQLPQITRLQITVQSHCDWGNSQSSSLKNNKPVSIYLGHTAECSQPTTQKAALTLNSSGQNRASMVLSALSLGWLLPWPCSPGGKLSVPPTFTWTPNVGAAPCTTRAQVTMQGLCGCLQNSGNRKVMLKESRSPRQWGPRYL